MKVIKKYNKYLNYRLFESILQLESNFYSFIKIYKSSNSICSYLYNVYYNDIDIKTNVNYLHVSYDKNSDILFLPDSQYQKVKDNKSELEARKKSSIAIGRAVRQILVDNKVEFQQKDIEEFVNLYKTFWDNKYANRAIEIVKGDEILFWYNQKNYASEDGQLGNSCMRFEKRNSFMKIYADNDDVTSMVILKDKEDKLLGRALLWKTKENFDDATLYLDRIYTRYDSDVKFIKNWVVDNIKEKITFYDDPKSERETLNVVIKKCEFEEYPYADTFCYISFPIETSTFEGVEIKIKSKGDGVLSNKNPKDQDYLTRNMQDTGGELDGNYRVCVISGHVGPNSDFVSTDIGYMKSDFTNYCKYDGCYYYKKDCVYSEYMKDWIPNSRSEEIEGFGVVYKGSLVDVVLFNRTDEYNVYNEIFDILNGKYNPKFFTIAKWPRNNVSRFRNISIRNEDMVDYNWKAILVECGVGDSGGFEDVWFDKKILDSIGIEHKRTYYMNVNDMAIESSSDFYLVYEKMDKSKIENFEYVDNALKIVHELKINSDISYKYYYNSVKKYGDINKACYAEFEIAWSSMSDRCHRFISDSYNQYIEYNTRNKIDGSISKEHYDLLFKTSVYLNVGGLCYRYDHINKIKDFYKNDDFTSVFADFIDGTRNYSNFVSEIKDDIYEKDFSFILINKTHHISSSVMIEYFLNDNKP